MSIFQLSEELLFPSVEYAEESGLLAIGGDLREERLLLAYASGIFPWYSEGYPILWWSPDPRLILIPDDLREARSLRQIMNKSIYEITFDTAFEQVIRMCATVHSAKDRSTWITDEMIEAYVSLHHSGYAHSVESWVRDELVGGLYGVSLGGSFFGESMFMKRSNASKVALVMLVYQLRRWNFKVIDCQVTTEHMVKLGAREIPRSQFLTLLDQALKMPTRRGTWSLSKGGE
jgi:leucyl/phenylalanyl-tRNA--protein transferase